MPERTASKPTVTDRISRARRIGARTAAALALLAAPVFVLPVPPVLAQQGPNSALMATPNAGLPAVTAPNMAAPIVNPPSAPAARMTTPNVTTLDPASGAANAQRDNQVIGRITNQTIDQFNAANAESRRFSEVQTGLRNQALQQRIDRSQSAIGCAAIGGAGANACSNSLDLRNRQQQLQLHNQARQQLNIHNSIQQGLGRPPTF